MNKFVLGIVVVAVIAVALGTAGFVYAQAPAPATPVPGTGYGPGMNQGRAAWAGQNNRGRGMAAGNNADVEGPLHDYMMTAFSDKLGIPAADLEARVDKGESMAQIASSKGLTSDQFFTLMKDAHTQAIGQAVKDGKLTQDQADWMSQRGPGMMGGGQGRGARGNGQGQFSNPACPYNTATVQ
jgi:hypothetical protein